jgi:two-component system cell cycle sensor histidine kinase/response regulator CckA
MEAIGTLAGGVAHDYNNHLQIMLLNLDLLEMKVGLPPVACEIVSQIRDATERSRTLTEQLLVFGHRSVAVPEVVALDRLLDETIPLYESLLGDRVRLRRVQRASEVRVRCDKGAVAQVVVNLLVNARDAMPDGGQVSIEVDVAEIRARPGSLSAGRYAALIVEDEGVGIPPQVLPRIYEPFFTTKEPGAGTGLGLSIAHTIVTEHGGALDVTSAVDRGTTVRILLPLADDGAALEPSLAKPEPFSQRSCGRVLLVEDEPAVRKVIGGLLGEAGYQVVEVENGAEALDLLEGSAVDLVLSDVSMPRMTGSELARTMAVKHHDVPIVLMAGCSDSSLLGIDLEILQKPFGRDELLRAVGTRIRSPSVAGTLGTDPRTLDRKL